MTWTAPEAHRVTEPRTGDERPMLQGWLDHHRQTLLHKCAGLTAEQLKQASVEPSNLTLLGLVRHMAEVERWWFRINARQDKTVGDIYCTEERPDGDFDDVAGADAEADLATFLAEIELCDDAVAALPLEHEFPGRAGPTSLRWVYTHMIEEYARHNGHADLLRERIDGVTGG
ncbi:DinB family protein [Actinoplanes siamensis]|uniref:DinB family protein n=1 Tax=Actinoplanes siamensis TaxID=1223317 RepID=UPI001940CF6E|nr:DinB family protein [Actinoplanes siamensis]